MANKAKYLIDAFYSHNILIGAVNLAIFFLSIPYFFRPVEYTEHYFGLHKCRFFTIYRPNETDGLVSTVPCGHD